MLMASVMMWMIAWVNMMNVVHVMAAVLPMVPVIVMAM
jgi:hypothetical protein